MELIRGIKNLTGKHQGCVATIGNFDGVHRGHQTLLAKLHEKAEKLQLPATVITFEPLPHEFFATENTYPRLTKLTEKLSFLQNHYVDRVICLRFNKHLSNLSAQDFIDKILVAMLDVRYLIIGDDFRFGHNRMGDFNLLKQVGERLGFEVSRMETLLLGKQRVSSRAVRNALAEDNLPLAEALLGRPYSMMGKVVHGNKRGRSIGVPTANILLQRRISAVAGVYAVKVYGLQPAVVYGVANVGNRPTVDGNRAFLEVHLFNFDHDIYGKRIQVEFVYKLRPEQRYENFELLKAQILRDIEEAKRRLSF